MRRLNAVSWLCGMLALGLLLLDIGACERSPFESPLPATPHLSPLPGQEYQMPNATLPPLTLKQGHGGAKGIIVEHPSEWTGKQLYVYFCPFYSGQQSNEGFYVLDPSIHPSTHTTPRGEFQLGNIPPGKYVIVVGPTPEESIPVRDGNRPRIFTILENEILEIGQVSLRR